MRTKIAWLFDDSYQKSILYFIFLLALSFRAILLLLQPDANISTNARTAIIGGSNLITQGEFLLNPDYPTLIPPLSALLMALVKSLTGDSLLTIKILQIILDSITVIMIFKVARFIVPYSAAILGTLAVAIYPFTAFTPIYIGSESLFTFFLISFVVLFLRSLKNSSGRDFFIAGILLGLATMTRGTTQFLPFFILPYLIWHYQFEYRQAFKVFSIFIIGFLVITSPWTIRNVIVLDAFIPTSTPGLPILNGSSEEFWLIRQRNLEFPKYFDYLKNEKGIHTSENPSWIEKGEFYKQAAIEKYKQRWEEAPISFIPFLLKKFTRLFYATESGKRHDLIILINLPIYIFTILGIIFFIRKHNKMSYFILLLFGYFILIHVAVFTLFRFLVPIMPLSIIIATYGFFSLLPKQLQKSLLNQQI